MSEKDYTINKDDNPLSTNNWREVYNLVLIIENMKVYNEELVDKYVKDISEKIYYLSNKKRIELNKSIRKNLKLIVSIDNSRINFESLKAFNPTLGNQIACHNSPKYRDVGTSKKNVERDKPSFYFNPENHPVDVVLCVVKDMINSFSSSPMMDVSPVNEIKSTDSVLTRNDSDGDYENIIPHNPLVESRKIAFHSQIAGHNIVSQNEYCEKRIDQTKCWETLKETNSNDYRISKFNTFASEAEKSKTDCSIDINGFAETCSSEMDEASRETIGSPLETSRRTSTVYQFAAPKLRRSERIQLSISKKRISEIFVPLQELKRKRFCNIERNAQ